MIEKVTDQPKDENYYRNAIHQAIIDYYEDNGIEQKDIVSQPLNTWSAAMRFCQRQCISRDDLKEKYSFGNGSQALKYNEKLVGELCNIFLEECEIYDKIPSAWAFGLLTGIERSTLQEWRGEYKREVTPGRSDMMKKVADARENALANRIFDGKKNPVGCIAALNFEFGWTNRSEIVHVSANKIPTSADLPVFTEDSYIPQLQTELPAFELPKLNGDFDLG